MRQRDREAPQRGGRTPASRGLGGAWASSRELSVTVVLVLLCLAVSFTSARDTFFTPRNLTNISRQVALLSVFALGETIVIIAGGIDLSLGSLIAFSGMVTALVATRAGEVMAPGAAAALAGCAALGVGAIVGAIHASLIHGLSLPPFVVTLASLLILRSQSLLVNDQLPITLERFPGLLFLANGSLFEHSGWPVPLPAALLVPLAVALAALLAGSRIGRYVYSVGSSEAASRLSGVNVYRVKLFAYGMSGCLGGAAGVLWAGYGGQGDPLAGNSYELDAVAAAVVGGASLSGGKGSILGTVLGATLLISIFSAINLTLEKPDLWRGTVVGGILLLAVLVSALRERGRAR
ncbi:MAG: ABC transporter permease [Chthonomonadales bacterium]|nr:ABC transporter permease [Chthonomonadales bacterium]